MSVPAISLWQPWASLLVTRQPCDACEGGRGYVAESCDERMVKRFETRSWPCPPSLIGQRFAIHAALRKPYNERGDYDWPTVGDWTIDYEGDSGQFAMWRSRQDRDAKRATPLPLGAVVGSGVVAACYPIVGSPLFGVEHILRSRDRLYLERYPTGPEGGKSTKPISGQLPYGDFTPGRYAWLIEGAIPLAEPIPCRGRQRIWHLPDDIAAQVEASP